MTLTELKTSNLRILEFYNKYENLSFETLNLTIIDLYEDIIKNINGDMNKIINNDILLTLKNQVNEMKIIKEEIKNSNEISKLTTNNIIMDIHSIKDIINKLNGEIVSNITSKIYEMKQMYIDDVKSISNNSNNEFYIKFTESIEKNNNIIIDKINDLFPTFQTNNELIISKFKLEMSKEIDNIRSSIVENKNEISLDKISFVMENKYNNLLLNIQQSILGYISSTENRLSQNINQLCDANNNNNINQQKINSELESFLNKHKISSSKGLLGESMLFNVLSQTYKTAEIVNTTGMYKSADFILKRENKKDILIENKDYNQNVSKDELNKFFRDIDEQKINGLFISNNSGIATKNNFQIDVNDGNIIVYIHNAQYCPEKISAAIDIIDNLNYRLLELTDTDNNFNISNELLSTINEQYQLFINKRETTINHIRETTKKTITYISELELSQLNIILSSKFAATKHNNLLCNICKLYTGNNLKSLSIHKRSCSKKNNNTNTNNITDVISNESDNIEETIDSNEHVPSNKIIESDVFSKEKTQPTINPIEPVTKKNKRKK
jgi:hypothetical protein